MDELSSLEGDMGDEMDDIPDFANFDKVDFEKKLKKYDVELKSYNNGIKDGVIVTKLDNGDYRLESGDSEIVFEEDMEEAVPETEPSMEDMQAAMANAGKSMEIMGRLMAHSPGLFLSNLEPVHYVKRISHDTQPRISIHASRTGKITKAEPGPTGPRHGRARASGPGR